MENFQVFDMSQPARPGSDMFITLGFQLSKTPDCAKHHIKLLKRPFKTKKRTNKKVVVC